MKTIALNQWKKVDNININENNNENEYISNNSSNVKAVK
jgi:hypothetical protein